MLANSTDGPHLDVYAGAERYGSCLARLTPATLDDGYLPVLRTAYVDARGIRYREVSFARRGVAYVWITSDAGSARLTAGGQTLRGGTIAAAWTPGHLRRIATGDFDDARSRMSEWAAPLQAAASIDAPDAKVMDAERATLIQNLLMTWRYSTGNPYEEFSFPESLDNAQVMSEYGLTDVAASILRVSLTRRPTPYANWKMGEKLLGFARHVELTGDHATLDRATPVLAGYVTSLARQVGTGGLLDRERYSSDIPDSVLGLHSQAVAWQGLARSPAHGLRPAGPSSPGRRRRQRPGWGRGRSARSRARSDDSPTARCSYRCGCSGRSGRSRS